jgi:hypothetical protein
LRKQRMKAAHDAFRGSLTQEITTYGCDRIIWPMLKAKSLCVR